MKLETKKTANNKTFIIVNFENKQFLRISSPTRTEWKKVKTNHFVNAEKFQVLEKTFSVHFPHFVNKVVVGHKNVQDTPLTYTLPKPDYKKPVTKEELIIFIKAGNRLGAVKAYKDATGLGLREAKDYIDALDAFIQSEKRWENAMQPTLNLKK